MSAYILCNRKYKYALPNVFVAKFKNNFWKYLLFHTCQKSKLFSRIDVHMTSCDNVRLILLIIIEVYLIKDNYCLLVGTFICIFILICLNRNNFYVFISNILKNNKNCLNSTF